MKFARTRCSEYIVGVRLGGVLCRKLRQFIIADVAVAADRILGGTSPCRNLPLAGFLVKISFFERNHLKMSLGQGWSHEALMADLEAVT